MAAHEAHDGNLDGIAIDYAWPTRLSHVSDSSHVRLTLPTSLLCQREMKKGNDG
jgi:hypothetical protein